MSGTAAVIVAAGRGLRAGGDRPKQWQKLAGRPVLSRTVEVFQAHPEIGPIVLVLHPDDVDLAVRMLTADITVALGGPDRAASVRNGLEALNDTQHVLIHDVARPLVQPETISAVIAALGNASGAAPALPVTDALWVCDGDGAVTRAQDRAGLYRAQTPQGFDLHAIREAHAAHPGDAADDVEVARAAGIPVTIVPGDEDNLKITHAEDFARAERILRGRNGH